MSLVREFVVDFVHWITICPRMDVSIGLVLVFVVSGQFLLLVDGSHGNSDEPIWCGVSYMYVGCNT